MTQLLSDVTTMYMDSEPQTSLADSRTALIELFGEHNRELIERGLQRFSTYDDCRQRAADWIVTRLTEQDDTAAPAQVAQSDDGGSGGKNERINRLMEMFLDLNERTAASALHAANDDEAAAIEQLLQRSADAKIVAYSSSSDDDERTVSKRKATSPLSDCRSVKVSRTLSAQFDESMDSEVITLESESHSSSVILQKVEEIVARYSVLDADAIYARLDESDNVDATMAEIIREYDEMDTNRPEFPGPSGLQSGHDIPQEMRSFITVETRAEIKDVITMFPDVDPSFVATEFVENELTKGAVVDKMLTQSYPRYKQRLETERKEKRRNDLLNLVATLDIPAFLRIFDNPEAHFGDTTRDVTPLYVEHTKVCLRNAFPTHPAAYITRVMEQYNNHFLGSIRHLSTEVADGVQLPLETAGKKPKRRKKKQLQITPRKELPWPETLDEQFFHELYYHHHSEDIRVHLAHEHERRERDLEKAREDGTLQECLICADDQCLPADMMQCTDDDKEHWFCRNCVGQHADQRISDGAHRVSCMHAGCDCEYTTDTLRSLLRPQQMNTLLRRMTLAQVQAANLQGIEECPFCDFAVIIENDSDRVFKCQNQNCLKESCRECKKDSHIPLRCEELEGDLETAMRKDIELAMSNALIRTCPGCKKQLIKSEGCNHMSCPCGTHMCYVCGEKVSRKDPYAHFVSAENANGSKCQQNTPINEVHANVAAAAGEAAKQKWLSINDTLRAKDIDIEQLLDRMGRHPPKRGGKKKRG